MASKKFTPISQTCFSQSLLYFIGIFQYIGYFYRFQLYKETVTRRCLIKTQKIPPNRFFCL